MGRYLMQPHEAREASFALLNHIWQTQERWQSVRFALLKWGANKRCRYCLVPQHENWTTHVCQILQPCRVSKSDVMHAWSCLSNAKQFSRCKTKQQFSRSPGRLIRVWLTDLGHSSLGLQKCRSGSPSGPPILAPCNLTTPIANLGGSTEKFPLTCLARYRCHKHDCRIHIIACLSSPLLFMPTINQDFGMPWPQRTQDTVSKVQCTLYTSPDPYKQCRPPLGHACSTFYNGSQITVRSEDRVQKVLHLYGHSHSCCAAGQRSRWRRRNSRRLCASQVTFIASGSMPQSKVTAIRCCTPPLMNAPRPNSCARKPSTKPYASKFSRCRCTALSVVTCTHMSTSRRAGGSVSGVTCPHMPSWYIMQWHAELMSCSGSAQASRDSAIRMLITLEPICLKKFCNGQTCACQTRNRCFEAQKNRTDSLHCLTSTGQGTKTVGIEHIQQQQCAWKRFRETVVVWHLFAQASTWRNRMAQPWQAYIQSWVPPGTSFKSSTSKRKTMEAARSASSTYALFTSCTRIPAADIETLMQIQKGWPNCRWSTWSQTHFNMWQHSGVRGQWHGF